MAFKPQVQQQEYTGPRIDYTGVNRQVKQGQRPARISLIVDLGEQIKTPSQVEYNPAQKKHKELKESGAQMEERGGKTYITVPPSKESGPEIAVFADLVNDVVDYGEELGKQPYRVMINHSFKGEMKGIAFEGSYPYAEGKGLNFDVFTFHSRSQLTALAKATGNDQVVSGVKTDPNNMDVEQLLNGAFYAKIEGYDNGLQGDDGRCYINYKGANPPPPSFDENGDEVPTKVKETTNTPMIITFDDVTEEQAKLLNAMVRKKIKTAKNYWGSQMQKVLEPNGVKPEEQPPVPQEPAHMQEQVPDNTTPAQQPTPVDDWDDDIPF